MHVLFGCPVCVSVRVVSLGCRHTSSCVRTAGEPGLHAWHALVLSVLLGMLRMHEMHLHLFPELRTRVMQLADLLPGQDVPALVSSSSWLTRDVKVPAGLRPYWTHVSGASAAAPVDEASNVPWFEGCYSYNNQAILQLRAIEAVSGHKLTAAPALQNEVRGSVCCTLFAWASLG
jgi:hypothetical protein